jgi:cytochrome oxidase assembly protein ShyY1
MNRSKGIATALLVAIAMAVFIALGFWQLDRAAQVKELEAPYQELPIVELGEVATPNSNLLGESVNRIVRFSGTYVAQLDAPNQVDGKGEISNWVVGLMEVDGGGNILVVRSNQEIDSPRGDVEVVGRIFHRQYEDVAARDGISLSRLDPALLLARYGGDFYDGYVIAKSESVNGLAIQAPRVLAEPARPTVPGYYWQHIAYVVIWWLMALVVLFLPFYSARRKRALQ